MVKFSTATSVVVQIYHQHTAAKSNTKKQTHWLWKMNLINLDTIRVLIILLAKLQLII
jgi:hypothetical protein